MKRLFAPVLLAGLALALAAMLDVVKSVEQQTLSLNRGATAWEIAARIIPDPFAIEALRAQGTRGPINVIAPYRVAVGTSAVQLTTSGNVNGGVCIKALAPGQTMYLGVSSAVTTSTGWPMSDRESLCLEVRNANVLYGIASAADQAVAVLPFSRY